VLGIYWMRQVLLAMMILVSSCTSTRIYDDIVTDIHASRTTDDISYEVYYWKAIDVSDEEIIDDQLVKLPEKDQESCIAEYRGIEFKDEVLATTYFFQCMNSKGWHLHTEEVIIIKH
jgi:hypothetical protein